MMHSHMNVKYAALYLPKGNPSLLGLKIYSKPLI